MTLKYIGHRPFKRLNEDSDFLQPGECVDDDHPYADHLRELAERADFIEVEDDG